MDSQTHSLGVSQSINEISVSNLVLGTTCLSASVANPFVGLIPGSNLNTATVQRRQLLRLSPQLLGITSQTNSVGSSNYNGFQILLQRYISAGTSASVSYTYSKTLGETAFANAQDANPEKVVAALDVTHSIQINGVYDPPFGRATPSAPTPPAAFRVFFVGWRISAIARLQSGLPHTMPTSVIPTDVNPTLTIPTLPR